MRRVILHEIYAIIMFTMLTMHAWPQNTPTLKFVSAKLLPMDLASRDASFEGGTLIRTETGLHLFTTDTSRGLNTSLVYYHASSLEQEFTFVRQVACCSSARADGTDQRASLWAPMPCYDASIKTWRLFYVEYKSAPSNASGWFWNFHGQIVSAVSTADGPEGIGGPYKDVGIVLRPDSASQSWEGLQGTDSISPPYLLRDNLTWAAFYGSAQTQHAATRPHNLSWYTGLVTTSVLGDPFLRKTPSSLVDFNHGFSENPIVTYLPVKSSYIAVFDDLNAEAQGFGVSWSRDGLHWDTPAALVLVPGGARTPLAALPEPDGKTLSVFYTAYVRVQAAPGQPERYVLKERVIHGTFTMV